VCLTQFSKGANSDERAFARTVVRFGAHLRHVEERRAEACDVEQLMEVTPCEVPQNYFRFAEVGKSHRQLANQHHAPASLYGTGGDELFQYGAPRWAGRDFKRRHGVTGGLLEIAHDAALMDGITFWRALSDATTRSSKAGCDAMMDEAVTHAGIVSPRAVEAFRARGLPATFDGTSALGAWWHAVSLAEAPAFHNPLECDDDPETLFPLLSQPLIERCVRIPSYLWMFDRWDRGIARKAFEDALPPQVCWRRGKGGMSEHVQGLIDKHVNVLHPLLQEGVLAQHGFLNQAELAAALSPDSISQETRISEVTRLICAEVFGRRWLALGAAP